MRDCRAKSWVVSATLLALIATGPRGLGSAEAQESAPDTALVRIHVVVSDRRGEPVTDLEAADFEASIDGIPTPIAALTPPTEPSKDSGPSIGQSLSLILYVDSTDVDLQRRAEVLERLKTPIRTRVGNLDRIMVVAAQAEVARPEQPFTGDAVLVAQALDRIAQSAPLPRQDEERDNLMREIERMLEPAQNRLDPESERDAQTVAGQLRAYAALQSQRTLTTCDRLQEAVDTLAALPGRRAIVYVGSGLPLNPGADLLAAVKSARPAIRQEGPLEAPNTSLPLDLGQGAATTAVAALGRYASLNDVAFYSFDIGQRQGAMSTASANIGIADAGSTQPGENVSLPAASFGRRSDLEDSLRIVATETGGLTVRKHQAVDSAMKRLIENREGAYTLAFVRPDSAPGSPHSIDIRTHRRRLDVRHRRSFRTPGEDDFIVERLRTALMGAETSNPLEASVSSRYAGPLEGSSYDVHLSVRVPVENLALQPLAQSHKAQITVFLAASDGDLWTSPIQKVVLPITIPNDEMLATMGRTIDYELDMRVFRGRERLALAVHDDLDPQLSILTLVAPQPGDGDPSGR